MFTVLRFKMISWFDHNLECLNQCLCNTRSISYLTLSYILDEDEFDDICNNQDIYTLNEIYKNKIISLPRVGITRAYWLGRKCSFDSKSIIKQPSIILLKWVNNICKLYSSYSDILNAFNNYTKIPTKTISRLISDTNVVLWQNENVHFEIISSWWGFHDFLSFVTNRRVLMIKRNKFLSFIQNKPIEILLRDIDDIRVIAGDGKWMGIG